MWGSWKFWLVMAAVGLMVALFTYGFTTDPKLVKSPLVNKPAPAFDVTRLGGGERLRLADLRGQTVVLNFWASWCAACRDEAHILEAAHKRFQREGTPARVIGIAVQDTPAKAMAFAKRFGKTYFLALDNERGDIGLNYGLYGVPETFFIDGEGIIRHKQIGPVTRKVIDEQVRALSAAPGAKP